MGVINIESEEHFQQTLGNGFAVIDFWAQFCGPCKRIAPEYEALSNIYKNVQFFKCNTREDGPDEVAGSHGVRALPTFMFYKNKKPMPELTFEGADMEKLADILNDHGVMKPFSGAGNSLGQSSNEQWEQMPTFAPEPQSFPNPITVDERKPKTKLQIRLADGTKLVQEFNHDHLISDVFMFVGCQDGFASNFIMKGGFPPREIMDNGETIKQGDLLGCIIIQSLVR